jgi:phosphatidylglycerol---prolipoprotein diacylglyceryl transferase
MWPETHFIWGLPFTLYDVFRGVAVAAALVTCIVLNRRQGISPRKTLLLAAACVPLCIGAARLLNAVEFGANWSNLGAEFLRNSGSSVYGALIACMFLVVALTRILHVPSLRFLDAGAPALAIGEAVSRVGCFCAGCCYGETWNGPWSVVFPGESFAAMDQRYRGVLDGTRTDSLPVHPVQIYAVVLMGLLAWALIRRFGKAHRDGTLFFLFLIGYGTYRLAIAPFRVEALASMKLFSVIFIAAGILGMFRTERPRAMA